MTHKLDLLYKPTPKFAHGGAVRTTMQEVHVNPEEVAHLDYLQGGPKFSATGKRQYRHLGNLFKNVHIQNAFHDHVAEHRANGGAIGRHEHASAANGRYGDTEIVEMPHHLVDIMNKAQGGAVYNPWDGKPEYFLGGLFSSFASKLGPMLGNIAKGASGLLKSGSGAISRGASALGRGLSSGAGALSRGASSIASKLPSMKAVGTGLGHAANIAGHVLPAYMQHRQEQQMMQAMQQQQQPEPVQYEQVPDDLYGGMANTRQLRAARQVTGALPSNATWRDQYGFTNSLDRRPPMPPAAIHYGDEGDYHDSRG